MRLTRVLFSRSFVDSGRTSDEKEKTGTLETSGARHAQRRRRQRAGPLGSQDPVALRLQADRLRVGEFPPRLRNAAS
jgi:hypothetical protein